MATDSRSPPRRFLLAGFLAPAVGGLWAGVFFAVAMAVGGEGFRAPTVFLSSLALAFVYAALIALLATWTIGLAWHATASARGWTSLAAYATFGAGAGAAFAALIYLLSGSDWTLATGLGVAWLASSGAVVAGAGWLIRRPDRDAAPNPPTSAP